jgi:hypothetical protein
MRPPDLLELEYRTLQARRRGSSKYRRPEPRMSETLLSSTPYIDPWRVEDAMYRPPLKDHWVTPEGFKTTSKPS